MEHRDRIPPPPARACACPLSQLRPDGGGFAPHAAFAYPGHCDARGRARGRLFDRDKKGIEPTRWRLTLRRGGGAASRPKGGRSTRLRHRIGGRSRLSPSTSGAHVDERPQRIPMPRLPTARRKAVGGRATTAHFYGDAEGPQCDFDSTSGPHGPAGFQRRRHSAPIARQRATRKARHSGLTWPTYCNKPKGAPPFMDGMGRTVARGGRRCIAEKEYLRLGFFEGPATGGACAPA